MANITSMTTPAETMKAGKITAKLRDAVPVSFMVGEDERIRYRNIEIPQALKELPIIRFGFHILGDGKIEFELHFAEGILPREFPAKRERQHRKQTQKTAAESSKSTSPEIKTAPEPHAAPTPPLTKTPSIASKPLASAKSKRTAQ